MPDWLKKQQLSTLWLHGQQNRIRQANPVHWRKKACCSVSGCDEFHETSPCGIYGGQGGTRTGFSLSTLVFPWQHHSTYPSYRFIHLSLALYSISNLQECWLAHSRRCLWQPISKTSQHVMADSFFSLVHSVLLKNIRKRTWKPKEKQTRNSFVIFTFYIFRSKLFRVWI
jgi:hypothetical protein